MQSALPTAPDVSRAVEKVYTRPELAPPEKGWLDPLWAFIGRVMDRIGEALGRMFGGLSPSDSPFLFWLVVALLAAAGLALIGYLLFAALGRLSEPDPAQAARQVKAGAPGKPRDVHGWEEEARRLAAEGRYREAAVALYQAMLLRMEAAGAVRYDPAKTPGDYRLEARPHSMARPLGAFLRAFEPAVFGGRQLDADVYERLRGAAAEAGARG